VDGLLLARNLKIHSYSSSCEHGILFSSMNDEVTKKQVKRICGKYKVFKPSQRHVLLVQAYVKRV